MSLGHGSSVVREGLVLYLDAANVKSYPGSGTTWSDLSGNGRNATLINSVQFTNDFLGEMAFDGTDDYATIAYNSNNFVNMNYTWEAWVIGVQVEGSTYNMPDIGYGSFGWPRMGFKLGRLNQSCVWQSYSNVGATSSFTMIVGPSSSTRWSYIAFTADYANNVCKTYYNGNVANTISGYPDVTGNAATLGIGRAGNTFNGWNERFNGKISSVTIRNSSLSASEIQQNFEALRGRYGI